MKTEKIIVKNQSDLSMIDCLSLIQSVIKLGRVSNNNRQYCYVSTIEIEGKTYHIHTDLRDKSDVFTILKSSK